MRLSVSVLILSYSAVCTVRLLCFVLVSTCRTIVFLSILTPVPFFAIFARTLGCLFLQRVVPPRGTRAATILCLLILIHSMAAIFAFRPVIFRLGMCRAHSHACLRLCSSAPRYTLCTDSRQSLHSHRCISRGRIALQCVCSAMIRVLSRPTVFAIRLPCLVLESAWCAIVSVLFIGAPMALLTYLAMDVDIVTVITKELYCAFRHVVHPPQPSSFNEAHREDQHKQDEVPGVPGAPGSSSAGHSPIQRGARARGRRTTRKRRDSRFPRAQEPGSDVTVCAGSEFIRHSTVRDPFRAAGVEFAAVSRAARSLS